MKLGELALVRTGLVISRKRADDMSEYKYKYHMLNLKCIKEPGYIDIDYIEDYTSVESLRSMYFTKMNDILIRLSAPYTVIIVKDKSWSNLLVPSHFAIIRADLNKAIPEYILWFLKHDSTHQAILQNSSGSSGFGTISSGFIGGLCIRDIPIEQQKILGNFVVLSEREQQLIRELAVQKAIYNKEIIRKIYNSIKRGN